MSARSATNGATADVVIIGGGVIGLTIARSLVWRGVRSVTLVERARFGAEASSSAAGILAPQVEADRNDELFRLMCASRDLYPWFADALREEVDVDVELDRTGTLYLGFSGQDEIEFKRRLMWQTEQGLRIELLAASDARTIEPHISERVRCALRFPNDWQVENRKLVEALVRANDKFGVCMLEECEVKSVRIENDQVQGVQTSKGSIATKTVVMAAGAWSSFVDSPDVSLPGILIEPVRGQMLCFKSATAQTLHVLYTARGYVVPRRDGRLLAGSTSDHVGFDKRVTVDGIGNIRSAAAEIIPALRHLSLFDSWAGLRPRAEDDFPVLGPASEIGGLFYATGHYRNGILLAPITGELIAEAIVTGLPSISLTPFLPDRFWHKPNREDRHAAPADARAADSRF